MNNRGRFHRKKIARAFDFPSARKKSRDDRSKYGEKDTAQRKLLQCGALGCQNVMYFAGSLSKATGS
jgi:hypothetical protein